MAVRTMLWNIITRKQTYKTKQTYKQTNTTQHNTTKKNEKKKKKKLRDINPEK